TTPEGSPPYDPSGVEPQRNAFVSVNLTPSTSTVPPLLGPGSFESSTPWPASHPLSSTIATTGQPCFLASSTVSPTWSPWPCVTAIASTRSGIVSSSGHVGLPFRNGST